MSNLFPIFCLASIGILVFMAGVLVGFTIRRSYRYRLMLNQNQGEASVRNAIISKFRSPHFHLLNNITLPFQDGTTQIDHILISTKGIFFFETKHYSGWIYGNELSTQWMQVKYGIKNRFQNPQHQNRRHVKAVHQLLDFLPKEHIHSIVVFSGSAEFKLDMPRDVMYLSQLAGYLNGFEDDVISMNRLQFCVGDWSAKDMK